MAYSSYARHAAQRVSSARDTSEEPPRRRGTITRVNRACNACRRAKIRCIGATSPPCERCRLSEVKCVLEKPRASAHEGGVDERVLVLEEQMRDVRGLLGDVVRAVCPELASSGSYRSPSRRYPESIERKRSASPRRRSASPHHLRGDVLALDDVANPLGAMSSLAGRDAPRPSGEVDPVSAGLVSEAEGRELVDIFYTGASDFINAYDPSHDTFASLRQRNAFSLTAVMMVGARARDGNVVSGTQAACRATAERMAQATLIAPSPTVETVKALILLAAYSDSGWLLAGHAVRIATELGLGRAFGTLLASGMGGGRGAAEVMGERERGLVERARVWYCVYRLEHQMSYGSGRAAIVREDSTIHNSRLLLDHPLSLESDVRLIYAVELLALRAPLHVELTTAPEAPLDEHQLARLQWANEQFDAWERHWGDVLRGSGASSSGFVRESLSMQRQLAELFINSQLLRGVHSVSDVEAMSDDKRALALRAMHNAARCVDFVLRGRHYSANLPHGTHYTHVCAAFAASFLIRIARFFPDELDLDRVADDVEEMAAVLDKLPAGRYARSLRLMLRKARREHILPERSAGGTAETPLPSSAVEAWLSSLQVDIDPSALHKAGVARDAPLPLFLSGDLGTSAAPSDAVPFVGLEDFFLPPGLDELLSFEEE